MVSLSVEMPLMRTAAHPCTLGSWRSFRETEKTMCAIPWKGALELPEWMSFGNKIYLVRVFVDVDRKPANVVTVYRTSNIAKYRRGKT